MGSLRQRNICAVFLDQRRLAELAGHKARHLNPIAVVNAVALVVLLMLLVATLVF
jgi:hypothetical protein